MNCLKIFLSFWGYQVVFMQFLSYFCVIFFAILHFLDAPGMNGLFYAIFELFLCNFLCNTAFFRRLRHEWGAVKLFYNLNMFLSESLDSGGKFCAFLHSKSIKTCNLQNLCFISWQTIFWLPNLQYAQNQNSAVKIDQKYPFRQKVH